MKPIAYRDVLDRRTFLRDHLRPRQPVILTGALERWYTADVWSFGWFGDAYGDRVVESRFPKSDHKLGYDSKSDTVSGYVQKVREGQSVRECGYVASLPLLPALRQFAVFPDYRWVDRWSGATAWVGPAGTETVLHCDVLDNLFAQIRGRKQFQLYVPRSIDAFGPPLHGSILPHARYRDSAPEPDYEFIVEEGELLYLPPHYWHRVISLEPSISVSLFWFTPRTIGRHLPRIVWLPRAKRLARRLRAMAKAVS